MATQNLKKIKYENKEVQVESAIRDGSGNNIVNTYQTKLTVNPATTTETLTGLTINGTSYAIESSGGGSAIEILDLR